MYSRFQLAIKYFRYYLTAANGRGHGTHSPFVFDFIIHVLHDKKKYDCYDKIEFLRNDLLKNYREIGVEDFGAGSLLTPFKKRKIKDIAASSLKKKKYAQLLFRIAKYSRCETIIELGTSLGITTCYLASANTDSTVYTLEGSESIASIASVSFGKAELKNIHLTKGKFEEMLPAIVKQIEKVDLVFIDGNHRKEATIEYFNIFLKKATPQSIFIFDDIHWSKEMEEAWKLIQQHDSITLAIDLFFLGMVFFSKDFKVKQHFTIRF